MAWLAGAYAAAFVGGRGLRWRELGIRRAGVAPALGAFVVGWAATQLLCAASAWRFDAGVMPVARPVSFAAGQLFGDALFEELLYRALLFGQLAIALRPPSARRAAAGRRRQPARVHHGHAEGAPLAEAPGWLGVAFALGCLLRALYARTGNLRGWWRRCSPLPRWPGLDGRTAVCSPAREEGSWSFIRTNGIAARSRCSRGALCLRAARRCALLGRVRRRRASP